MKQDTTTQFTNEHYGKWVALSSDKTRIIDYSESFAPLAQKLGTKDVVYIKPLDPALNCAF